MLKESCRIAQAAVIVAFMAAALLTACQSTEAAVEPSEADMPEEAADDQSEAAPPQSQADTTNEPISDTEATELMYLLSEVPANEQQPVIDRIVAAGDQRFIPVFMELMRAAQIGITTRLAYEDWIKAMESLSGQQLGASWATWIEWYGTTDIEPPPGFLSWKGELLGKIDERFAEFLRDDVPVRLRPEEIVWGGVVVDGIPALINPAMLTADQADYLQPGEPVFGLEINGDARAYPLRIMDWHEMANDVVGDVPISLAYCTLCGAAIAYDGRAPDGNTYTFGSSGFLYHSNKLMYDHQTKTLWNHLTGEPVLGELADQDFVLDYHPVVLTSWEEWLRQHPDTLVLDINTGYARTYEPGAAYGDYFASDQTMFPVWQRSDLLPDKSQIYALRLDGVPKAYPLELLISEEVVNDTLADTPVVLIASGDILQVNGTDLRSGPAVYNAGGEVRAYDRGEETFSPGDEPETVVDSQGREWQVTEEALIGPDGEEAPRLSGHLAYWFGWYSFFPQTLVYGEDES